MKKIVFAVALLAFATMAVSVEGASKPNYKPGDRWVFTYSSVSTGTGYSKWDNGEYVAIMNADYTLSVFKSKNSKPVGEIYASGKDFDEETSFLLIYRKTSLIKWLRFPLKVDDEWDERYLHPTRDFWKESGVKVIKKESITTPAGTFQAFKLIREAGMKGKRGYKVVEYWYSEETRSIIKLKSEREAAGLTHKLILKSYSVPK